MNLVINDRPGSVFSGTSNLCAKQPCPQCELLIDRGTECPRCKRIPRTPPPAVSASVTPRWVWPNILPTVDEVEASLIVEAWRRSDGNANQAHKLIGMARTTFYRKLPAALVATKTITQD